MSLSKEEVYYHSLNFFVSAETTNYLTYVCDILSSNSETLKEDVTFLLIVVHSELFHDSLSSYLTPLKLV